MFVWVFYSQVVVVESLSGMDALSRSNKLMEGHRLNVFGMLLAVVLIFIPIGIVTVAVQLFLPPGGTPEVIPGGREILIRPINWQNFAILRTVSLFTSILGGTYMTICLTLTYFDLRVRKEGFDLELAARQQGPAFENP